LAFAGLWESFRWPDETVTRSFTHPDNSAECRDGRVTRAHAGRPGAGRLAVWLGEAEGDHATLLRPAADGLLRVWPVDRRVGPPKNNGPELLEAIAA
jgi:putative SOS response-associated peptidase YedK